jgi:hypothetical protein
VQAGALLTDGQVDLELLRSLSAEVGRSEVAAAAARDAAARIPLAPAVSGRRRADD